MAIDTTAADEVGSTKLDRVVIRFAGDSGDGMQLVGDRFTELSAAFGNDLATLPNYPAEIRAPAGTVAGVSSFQVHISDHDIVTPGDGPNVLVAMNPAALKANLRDLSPGSSVIVNIDSFTQRDLDKADYEANPLEDDSLGRFNVYRVPMTSITIEATKELGVKPRDAERSKNFFALGLICWMYTRPAKPIIEWIESKYSEKEQVRDANLAAFRAGRNFGETAELFDHPYEIQPATLPKGTYTNIVGNTAVAYGLIAGAQQAKLALVYPSYPITPASEILHELSKHKNFGVRTMQAEDEIAAAAIAIGAAFSGALAVTGTSGPGLDLKAEALGLAVSLELPMVIVDVQRAGPSTGMPTKTEQTDLFLALYGRHGESPLPVVAAASPSDCFDSAFEAVRLAVKYRTPVILLTDGYLANGAEPWLLPDVAALPDISVEFATSPNHDDGFWPYLRDPVTLARPWAVPGTPKLMHRIGGIEKEDGSGNISYQPENHERMVRLRQAKVEGISADIPPIEVDHQDGAELLVIGWGSTWGAIKAGVRRVRAGGHAIAQAHIHHLNPLPANIGEVMARYPKVLCPEMNLGQLAHLLRGKFLVDVQSFTKVTGVPFRAAEMEARMLEEIAR
ncbi:MAG: 2-oxoacid:acceptor oxidoreductase subunit alpha [Microthrixaceae bacterium]|nr:2-oxoacid:acceptor oxidoreductase subunit alpha [Microthrixaceae bacterium]